MHTSHRLLARQLRRLWNLSSPASTGTLFDRLEALAASPDLDRESRNALLGLRAFVERVDASYHQFERALSLRARSLDLSSRELLGSNRRLQAELEARSGAAASLRELAEALVAAGVAAPDRPEACSADAAAGDELGGLADAIAALGRRIEQDRRQLREARDAAERASRMKSEFLANMSHEIRTPMNGVIGMADLALGLARDERQRDYLATLRSSATALLTILNDMLDFAKIESGNLQLESTSFHLERLLRDITRPHSVKAAERGVALDLTISPALPRRLVGDPVRLGQVLGNLLSNAVKFTPGGRIRCAASPGSRRGGSLRLEVADTGIGIALEQQARIFEPFVQAESSTTRRFGGTGLGLSITRRLVDAMSGRIMLDSEPGRGARFVVELPVQADDAGMDTWHGALDGAPQVQAEAAAASGPRVLLAEDHPVNQKVAIEILRRRGCRIQVAEDGAEAVRLWLQGDFDLVLMDMHMPLMSGLDAAREIRRREPAGGRRTPIVALTASALPADRERCLAAGMDHFIAKPIRAGELLDVVALCTGAPPPFDYAVALRGADAQVAHIVADAFLDQAPRDLAQMRTAVEAADTDTLRRIAHSLRSLLEGLKALPAQREAERLEKLAPGLPDTAAESLAALRTLDAELVALAPHLRRHALRYSFGSGDGSSSTGQSRI
jgi:signal transduction histidine kinase/CheY-like chemotaxis protein